MRKNLTELTFFGLGVAGRVGQMVDVYAQLIYGFLPFVFVLGTKNQIGIRGDNQPVVVFDFCFQLVCGPTAVAQSNEVVFGADAESNVG